MPTRASAFGRRRRKSDDFPTPEWPTNTDTRPAVSWSRRSTPEPFSALTVTASSGIAASAIARSASSCVPRSTLLRQRTGTNPPRRARSPQRSTRPGRNGGSASEEMITACVAFAAIICVRPRESPVERSRNVRRGATATTRMGPGSPGSTSTSSPTASGLAWRLPVSDLRWRARIAS